MNNYPQVITGKESVSEQDRPIQALINFYRAFNSADLVLMEQNWLQSSTASMSNPLGGVKRGWSEIRQVYERIFNGPAQVYVEYYDYSLHQSNEMFTVVGRERGYFQLGAQKLELAIRTSRIYCLNEGQWYQLHHHGSIDVPDNLSAYQGAVLQQN